MRTLLREIIASQFKVPTTQLNEKDGPHTLPGWDSAAHIGLILALEKQFGLHFSDEEVTGFVSLEKIDRALTRHGVPT